jgi:S-adenosylmethionine hydrolase
LGRPNALSEAIEPGSIPDVPEGRVAYVDGYGNIKTTIRFDGGGAGPGGEVRVRIGDSEQVATQSDGTFAVEHGRMSFAPGSSGWTDARGGETRWMELFLRGGSAWEAFGRPEVGARIEVSASS